MAANSLQFHPGLPDECPLQIAEAVNLRVFRAIKGTKPIPWDFESHAERAKIPNKTGSCKEWGLSVWVSMEAARHALEIIKAFRGKSVVGFDATPQDGVIAKTESAAQSDHHTFWKVVNIDLCPRCTVEIEKS